MTMRKGRAKRHASRVWVGFYEYEVFSGPEEGGWRDVCARHVSSQRMTRRQARKFLRSHPVRYDRYGFRDTAYMTETIPGSERTGRYTYS